MDNSSAKLLMDRIESAEAQLFQIENQTLGHEHQSGDISVKVNQAEINQSAIRLRLQIARMRVMLVKMKLAEVK
ncbi:hypothetical protein [Paucilactobacillus nenjiangensis]|uniref:hypothetical protein n=1 Tax=Paucilactobacillus nenjiangensis TaxID=1296540 RepID=UPI0028D18F4B|nr:hypothetical protein [Paucilactobacillus nenjiangensis]